MESFEIASVRPPSENYSLSISTHFYCPWGKCAFCPALLFSQTPKFQRRKLDDIIADIESAKTLFQKIVDYGPINQPNIMRFIAAHPSLSEEILHLAYWHLYAYESTAFLGGANPLLYKKEFLTSVINKLQSTFPSINRITCYGRTRTAAKKGLTYFQHLHNAGLDRIHVGVESGSDDVLNFVNKGATQKDHIEGGLNIKNSGISLCCYVMPGLGGRKWSHEHAVETARVINQVKPEFVRLRTLEIFPVTKLHEKVKRGEFVELKEEEIVEEIRLLVDQINTEVTITSDSAANLLIDVWGILPKDKDKILDIIDSYLALDKHQKLEFSLQRRLEAYKSQYGALSKAIQLKYETLRELSDNLQSYYSRMEDLIRFVRQRLIP